MTFPNLRPIAEETRRQKAIESEIIAQLRSLLEEEYGVTAEIACKGSTEKGTSITERFFGVDLDFSIRADSGLLDKICYVSDLFEGCQIFRMEFLAAFRRRFGGVYYAGHRVSGVVQGYAFDLSVTDISRDRWKWDYNASRYLRLSDGQREEVRKLKFFLKTFNVYSTEVYGFVGPAVELLVYHHDTFDEVFRLFSQIPHVPECIAGAFSTVEFPDEFYAMFPDSEDEIHAGLVRSFRYTCPNTLNRFVEAVRMGGMDVESFVKGHVPPFSYRVSIGTDNQRLLGYILSHMLTGESGLHVDLLRAKGGLTLYASAGASQARRLGEVTELAQKIHRGHELRMADLPQVIQCDIERKCLPFDPAHVVFFVAYPELPLKHDVAYVPFDFLVRQDACELIHVVLAGQGGRCA